jgi:DNA-binding phage protein
MSEEQLKKLKENYYDEQSDKSEWFLEVRERAKNFPRNSIEHYAPHKAAFALHILAQGARISDIAKKTGISRASIRTLEWRHNDTLETKRKEFSMRYAIAAQEYTDLLFERAEQLFDDPDALAKISPEKLAITVGVLTDKAAQLTGMATTVVEHRKGASIDDAARMISEAKARIASKIKESAIDVEFVDVPKDS